MEFERVDQYFDLHVPHAEHYVAEGVVHHNTGKSAACLNKVFACANKYPGMRAAFVRATRVSQTQTSLVTWEKHVVPAGHPVLEGPQRSHRESYRFPNGSEVVVVGMDKPSRLLSSEYDLIYVQEAIELTEEAWETAISRLRNPVMPYRQILADTNPDAPTHWLKKRCDSGKTRLITCRHEDNPVLWDGGGWTPLGREYIAGLDSLTGPRKSRLRFGEWVQAEGAVYPAFSRDAHVVAPFDLPGDWPRYVSIDFGFTNHFGCLWGAHDPERDRLYVYRQYARANRLVADHAAWIASLQARDPAPSAYVCDHDAEGRATLERALGVGTVAADKRVTEGVQAVSRRLDAPSLFLFRDCLAGDSPRESSAPVSLEEELEAYVYPPGTGGLRRADELPVKKHDHLCFPAGTSVMTPGGGRPIESLRPGDRVWTRDGVGTVRAAGLTADGAELWEASLADGRALAATAGHPVWTEGRGFVRLDSLRCGDVVRVLPIGGESCQRSQKSSCSTVSGSAVTRTRRSGVTGSTTCPASPTGRGASAGCTRKSGGRSTGTSRKGMSSTIGTATRSTTTRTTWNVCRLRNTRLTTPRNSRPITTNACGSTCTKYARWRPRGTAPRRGGRGTANTGRRPGRRGSRVITSATIAGPPTGPSSVAGGCGSVPTIAGRPRGGSPGSMTSITSAKPAGGRSGGTSTRPGHGSVRMTVAGVRRTGAVAPVYNLTVDGGEYYASGVLVHNCDALRYMCMYVDAMAGGILAARPEELAVGAAPASQSWSRAGTLEDVLGGMNSAALFGGR